MPITPWNFPRGLLPKNKIYTEKQKQRRRRFSGEFANMNTDTTTGMKTITGPLALATCLLLAPTYAIGLDYYTWVDENGITHLSEEPPEDGSAQRVRVDVPAPARGSTDPNAEYYSITNQYRRMEASRREREKILAERNLEKERLELEREQLALQAYISELSGRSDGISRWHRDAATEFAEFSLLDSARGSAATVGRGVYPGGGHFGRGGVGGHFSPATGGAMGRGGARF